MPREIPTSTFWYAGAMSITVGLEIALAVPTLRRAITTVDDEALRLLADLRAGPVTSLALGVERLASANAVKVLAWVTIAVLLLRRRLRRLFAYLTVLLAVVIVSGALNSAQGRMRSTTVDLIGPWKGYAHPSAPVAIFAALTVGAVANLVPRGRLRRPVRAASAVLVGLLCLSRLYLGVDRPTDVLAALAIGWASSVVTYRFAVPEDAFPIRYSRERTAHLELTPARRSAIRQALEQQLGLVVDAIKPFRLAASAGSTPLRIRMSDGSSVFGKLYALNHLRADRSYKLARMVLYGRLEDEKPFASVRRLVEYEDHLLRLLRDNGLPVPAPMGFVEITPEREYLLVMGFLDGARELGDGEVQEQQIDEGLAIVRKLWRAGVAHRDIKPSNLLVKDGRVHLIDVAFATVRPTPWRQAVDLANMMLTLALASDARAVYQRAIRQFAPEDIAEAFAASRSVTIPTQLRARLRGDRRDLVAQFRSLAPSRKPVPIQLWSVRRALTLMSFLVAATAVAGLIYAYARTAGLL